MTTEVMVRRQDRSCVPEALIVGDMRIAPTEVPRQWKDMRISSYANVLRDYHNSATLLDKVAMFDRRSDFTIEPVPMRVTEPESMRVATGIASGFRSLGFEAIADGFCALYSHGQALSVTAMRDAAGILNGHHAASGSLTGLESDNDGVVHLRWDNDAESLTIMVACLARHRVRYFVREKGELRCDAACHSDDTVGVLRTFFDCL